MAITGGHRWYGAANVDVDDLRSIIENGTTHAPSAIDTQQGIPIYEGSALRLETQTGKETVTGLSSTDRQLLGELADVLANGPGIFVVKRAVDLKSLDLATTAFLEMIAAEKGTNLGDGDHFAAEGINDRVWIAMEKLAIDHPSVFAEYYANEVFDVVSKAWLGPGYQIASQVNVVNPGGSAQNPHRDFHLGFMSDHEAEQFPAHVHHLSPALTLQGAVAHDDMPLDTGPTTFLPHSQKFGPGYVAWRSEDVQALHRELHVQLPLERGDAVFFNPAVIHGAGTNVTANRRRMANLLQISSGLGRSMEAMDRRAMCLAVAPVLATWIKEKRSPAAVDRVIAAAAEGYAFPTNLDTDEQGEGLHPQSQANIMREALAHGQSLDAFIAALDTKAKSQRLR